MATSTTTSVARATRVALVANAGSRSCDPGTCADRLRALGAEVEQFAIDEVEQAVAAAADRIVVAGGDGSIAVAAAAAGAADTPLALLPTGTANDFAKRLELPLDLEAACRLAVNGTETAPMELGWMDDRPFVNVASAGLPGPAARTAKRWKKALGPLGYAAGALVAGARAKALAVEVGCEGGTLFDGRVWQVTVAASGAFGAGSRIDAADPHDGKLEVIAVEAGPRVGLIALAYRLRAGNLSAHPRGAHARCKDAVVRSPKTTAFNVDGEIVETASARFRGEADAFRLVVG